MADVVGEGEGFGEVLIETESAGDGASDLGNFESVGKAAAEMVGEPDGEYLGFFLEAAEGPGMNNAVAVASKLVAVGM